MWVLVVWFFVAGVGVALFDVWWHTALQQRIPAYALSRVSSEVLLVGGAWALGLAVHTLAIPAIWRLRALHHEPVG